MRNFQFVGLAILSIPLLSGASVAADTALDSSTVTKVNVVVTDGATVDPKHLDFSCAAESQGQTLGTFSSMPGTLVIPKRVATEISITCIKPGYQVVKYMQKKADGELLNSAISVHFSSKPFTPA